MEVTDGKQWGDADSGRETALENAAKEAAARIEQMEAKWKAAIEQAGVATEQEMRDAKVPTFDTEDALLTYLRSLVDRPHDYGSCVYAMSMAAVAAYNYVARKLGVTGFQASCADLDIIRRTRGIERFRILDYGNLLYPQYCDAEHFPDPETLIRENRKWLAEEARRSLGERGDNAHPNVVAHWQWLASLSVDGEEGEA